jgi:hypothetical protein
MKKLALCFSGHPRTFQDCYPSIKSKILDKYDCDIFISTYHMSKEISDSLIECYHPKRIVFHNKADVKNTCSQYRDKLGIIKVFHTGIDYYDDVDVVNKEYSIEEAFDYDKRKGKITYDKFLIPSLCQFFGIYDVSKLCLQYISEHNVEYDYILRLRLDNEVLGELIFDDLEENEVVMNTLHNYSHSIKAHDHFFLAKPNTYFKIAELYNNLPNIIRFVSNNNKCWLPTVGYPETLLFLQIMLCGIKITTIKGTCLIQKNVGLHPLYKKTLANHHSRILHSPTKPNVSSQKILYPSLDVPDRSRHTLHTQRAFSLQFTLKNTPPQPSIKLKNSVHPYR